MDNFPKPLALQYYWAALQDMMVLPALVQCPRIADLWIYVEQIWLSTESNGNIVLLPSFNQEGKAIFNLCHHGDYGNRGCVVDENQSFSLWPISDGLLQPSFEKENKRRERSVVFEPVC